MKLPTIAVVVVVVTVAPLFPFLSKMFPTYLWSNSDFHTHRLAYWYVVNSITQPELEDVEETDEVEAYYEIYSDY